MLRASPPNSNTRESGPGPSDTPTERLVAEGQRQNAIPGATGVSPEQEAVGMCGAW